MSASTKGRKATQSQLAGARKPRLARRKSVIQYDKNMNCICEYGGISVAATETKIRRTAIDNNLNGRSKTAGGFIWKYKNDISNL